MYKIHTEISGGVTGYRSSFLKQDGEVMVFGTWREANDYIKALVSAKNIHIRRAFSQSYTAVEA